MIFGRKSIDLPTAETAIPGRTATMPVSDRHAVNGNPLVPPTGGWPDHLETAVFAMGCFWGAERIFWQSPGVYTTAVGYAGGFTANPTYQETCTGMTGHTEVVLVVFDTDVTSFSAMLKLFWENHDPTQGMRQGNDVGSQYRSAIYTVGAEQAAAASQSAQDFQPVLSAAGLGPITTEIAPLRDFYYAEDYHQQYLHKVPNGYCGIGGHRALVPDRGRHMTDPVPSVIR